jgi:hypothetical protein
MVNELYKRIYKFVKEWEPEEDYDNEPEYRDDLLKALKSEISSKSIIIKKEDGRGYCDIGVNHTIGIELKLDLKGKSEVDRLKGQLMDYVELYPVGVILLLLGKTGENELETIKETINRLQKNGRNTDH